jgi:hypothetical protein
MVRGHKTTDLMHAFECVASRSTSQGTKRKLSIGAIRSETDPNAILQAQRQSASCDFCLEELNGGNLETASASCDPQTEVHDWMTASKQIIETVEWQDQTKQCSGIGRVWSQIARLESHLKKVTGLVDFESKSQSPLKRRVSMSLRDHVGALHSPGRLFLGWPASLCREQDRFITSMLDILLGKPLKHDRGMGSEEEWRC